MALCQTCSKRSGCKEICKEVKKEITGRGKTASRKPRTYPVDFSRLENSREPLTSFQLDVLGTIKENSESMKKSFARNLDLQDAIDNALSQRGRRLICLVLEGYRHTEIAEIFLVSPQRIFALLGRALSRLRNYMSEGL